MILIVLGPDAATARRTAEEKVRALDPEDRLTSRFDAQETSTGTIAGAVGTAGFFGDGRVVMVRGLLAKAGRGRGGDEDEGAATGSAAEIIAVLNGVAAGNSLVLLDPEMAAVPAAIKRAMPTDAEVIGCEPPRGPALVKWIVERAHMQDAGFDQRAAQELAAALYPQTWSAKPSNPRYDRPPDMDLIGSWVDELVLYAHPDAVSAAHVKELVPGTPNDRIFTFIERAANGQLGEAAVELERLLGTGEDPAKLNAQVLNQVELSTVAAVAGRVDPNEVGRAIGLSNPAQMAAISRSRQGATISAKRQLLVALENDRAFKRGRIRKPSDALVDLLVRLSAQ